MSCHVMSYHVMSSAASTETTDTAYCGLYTSSPTFASCCGVTVRQVYVSDEKFVVLSSNRAKMVTIHIHTRTRTHEHQM